MSLDAFHSVGVIPVDVKALGVDFLSGGVLKWLCGGPGGAFLYVRPESDARCAVVHGMAGARAAIRFEPEMHYADDAWRWLNGTPAIPALFAAIEGPRIVRRAGIEKIREKSMRQTSRLIALADERGYKVTAPREPRDAAARWRSTFRMRTAWRRRFSRARDRRLSAECRNSHRAALLHERR